MNSLIEFIIIILIVIINITISSSPSWFLGLISVQGIAAFMHPNCIAPCVLIVPIHRIFSFKCEWLFCFPFSICTTQIICNSFFISHHILELHSSDKHNLNVHFMVSIQFAITFHSIWNSVIFPWAHTLYLSQCISDPRFMTNSADSDLSLGFGDSLMLSNTQPSLQPPFYPPHPPLCTSSCYCAGQPFLSYNQGIADRYWYSKLCLEGNC